MLLNQPARGIIVAYRDEVDRRELSVCLIERADARPASFKRCKDGLEVLKLLKDPKNHYDVMICQATLPGKDVFALLDYINTNLVDGQRLVHHIIVTADKPKDVESRALRAGAALCLARPYNELELNQFAEQVVALPDHRIAVKVPTHKDA